MNPEPQADRPSFPAWTRLIALLSFELFLVVALHQLGRYEWMRVDWSDVGRWASDSPAEDVLVSILRTGTLVLAWWLLISTIVYSASALAGSPGLLRSIRWAMFPAVRRMVDGVVALSITSGSILARPALASPAAMEASPLPDAGIAAQHAALPAEPVALRLAIYPQNEPLPDPAPGAHTYTVQAGDSLWRIAEDHLRDGERWPEIWVLNHDRFVADGSDDPNMIHIGWVLVLPATTLHPEPAVASVEGTNGGVPTHTVGAGDSMWSVAEDQLTRAWGRQPATDEVSAYWQSLLALNETQLASSGDPNRIYAGQQILLAAVPADPEGASPSPVPTVTEPPVPLPETPPPAPSTTQPTAPPTSTTARPADNTPVPAERSVERAPQAGEEALPARLLAEIAGLTLLATGLLVRLRLLRRRQRAAQGVQSSGSGSVPAPLEQGLAATADLPLSRWAGQELARLAQRLDPHRLGAGAPVAVELSEDSGIEMLWNQRMPDPPSPWKAIDEGWAWKLAYDPEAAVPPDELPAPVPALVTVGERDRRQLLIDLEAYGSIALAGDAERVTEFATALALELGASEELANAYVYTVGYESPGTAQLDRVTAVDEDDATRRLSSRRTEVDEALTSMNVSSAFAMRCGPDAPGLETVVVFSRATDPQVNGEFIVHSPSGHGVAAVIFGSAPAESGARITLGADGTARFDPLGIVFRPAGMPVALAERVNVLLAQEPTSDGPDHDSRLGTGERAERVVDPVEPEPPQPFVAENTDPLVEELAPADEEPSQASQTRFFDPGRLHVAARDGKQVDSDDRLVVRVLGPPRIPDRPGLGRRELELIVLIACKEKPVHPSTVLNAIWGGKQVQGKTLWNLMARARKALGTFDDGEEILPPADRVRNSLRLSDRVVTDLALLRDLYEQALHESSTTAIALLRQGLNLVEGEPFDTPGYNWAHHQDQYVHEAAALIEDAATQLVELATTAGDTATARDAILRGLRGLPGNEALYRARMELEHATGNTAAVHAAWDELVEFLFDLDSEPSEATRTVYERLTGGHAGDLNS